MTIAADEVGNAFRASIREAIQEQTPNRKIEFRTLKQIRPLIQTVPVGHRKGDFFPHQYWFVMTLVVTDFRSRLYLISLDRRRYRFGRRHGWK